MFTEAHAVEANGAPSILSILSSEMEDFFDMLSAFTQSQATRFHQSTADLDPTWVQQMSSIAPGGLTLTQMSSSKPLKPVLCDNFSMSKS